MRDTTQIKHIDEVLKLFSAMTGDSRYVEVMEMGEYKEVDTMCEMFDRAVNKGIEAGIKQASAIIKEKEEQILEQANQLSQKEEQIKDKEEQITRNAMLVYPYIKRGVISHGKAAEMLGINKIDLIGT